EGEREESAEPDADEAADPDRPAVHLHQKVHRVHADHDEVHVRDPDDVDHAEDQVEPQGEQREHTAEQQAVHGGLDEEDGVDHRPTYALRTKSCSASASARPSILRCPASSRYARSTSLSTCRTFCSTTSIA